MAKKEKEIELKPKVEKIDPTHLIELQEVVNKINSYQFNIGKIETQKHQYLHALIDAQTSVKNLQDMLVRQYGTYDVNLEDGTINWPEENGDPKNEK